MVLMKYRYWIKGSSKSIDKQHFLPLKAKNFIKHNELDSFSAANINIRSLSKNFENFKTLLIYTLNSNSNASQKRGRKKISYRHYFIDQVLQLFIKKEAGK